MRRIHQPTPFDFIEKATRKHRLRHWCSAYAFKDGAGLIDIARQCSPARILELGTALGFTACCLASSEKAVRVDTIEGDTQHAALAQTNIKTAGLAERIIVHLGRFEVVLRSLIGRYDMAFFDGGSPSMPIIEQLHTLLDDEGVLICANLSRANAGHARELKREFDNADRWQRIGLIEDGGTLILRKQEKYATGESRRPLLRLSDSQTNSRGALRMVIVSGSAKTASGSKYLQQLCKHWGHKFEVEFSKTRGRVRFPSAVATLVASADALLVTIETTDTESIEQLKDTVTRHLDRFAFREAPLPFEWLAGSPS